MDHRLVILAVCVALGLVELVAGRTEHRREHRAQLAFDLLSSGVVGLVVSPLVTLAIGALSSVLFPESRGALGHLPVLAMVGILLVGDDLTQYFWHRASHSLPALYTLHRAHHSAPYMSVSMMYRNNLFYYALMPSLWISGALVHLGFGPVYAGYIVVKLTVIAAAHSSVRWDEPLYRIRALHHVMWVVERVISTPSTHAMHHGRHVADGVTHYAGNYGNLLFLWDVLFGTARITRRYPEAYGIEGLEPQSFATELVWPLVPLAPARAESHSPFSGPEGTPATAPVRSCRAQRPLLRRTLPRILAPSVVSAASEKARLTARSHPRRRRAPRFP